MNSVKVAIVFLIILLAMLGYVTFLKFTYVEEKKDIIINNVSSVSLSDIADNYNNKESDVKTDASIDGTTLKITYNGTTYPVSFTNGILKLETTESDDTDNLFVLLVDAVAVAKKHNENESIITTNLIINSLFFNDSIKVVKNDNNVMYVIDTTKDLVLYEADNIYKDLKVLNINDNDYDIEMNNVKLISPLIEYNSENNSFDVKAYIDNSSEKEVSVKIVLYDKDKKQVKDETVNVNVDELLLNTSIELSDLNEEDIIYVSYEIK